MSKKRKIIEILGEKEFDTYGCTVMPLDELIDNLLKYKKELEAKGYTDITVTEEFKRDYDDTTIKFYLFKGTRLETDEEVSKRDAANRKRQKTKRENAVQKKIEAEVADMKEYERLKKKYKK